MARPSAAGQQEAAQPGADQIGDRQLHPGEPGAVGESVGEDADTGGLAGDRRNHGQRRHDEDDPAVVEADRGRMFTQIAKAERLCIRVQKETQ